MRGSREDWDQYTLSEGIIPAHAGLTLPQQILPPSFRDHPRACGAHPEEFRGTVYEKGSSPRMRGSPFHAPVMMPLAGIIPAHAGLTKANQFPVIADWDHPRACGAHTKKSQY